MFNKFTTHKDKIVFQFMDETKNGVFETQSESGLTIQTNERDQMNTPRWAKVVSSGNNVEGVSEGGYILIEPLKWTQGFEFGGETYWATGQDQIICFADDKPPQYK